MKIANEEEFLDTYKCKTFGKHTLKKYGHWFPIKSSPTLARIVANLITDGHLQLRISTNGTKDYSYLGVFSNDVDELMVFSNNVNSVFGVNGRIRTWGVRKFGFSLACIIINSPLCRVLNICGVPGGNKASQLFDIPKWIKNSDEEVIKAFIRTCFDCDGTIKYDKNMDRWKISFEMVKTETALQGGYLFLSSFKMLLDTFKIKTTNIVKAKNIENIRKDGKITRRLWFDISNKSIVNFCKIIGSYKKEKIKRINIILNGL